AFMGITNETLLATALPSIQEAFSITQSEVQWLTTAFLMANGIMIPISAFLIERFTTRTLFLTAISIFGAGTIISALAPIFPVLLLGRICTSIWIWYYASFINDRSLSYYSC